LDGKQNIENIDPSTKLWLAVEPPSSVVRAANNMVVSENGSVFPVLTTPDISAYGLGFIIKYRVRSQFSGFVGDWKSISVAGDNPDQDEAGIWFYNLYSSIVFHGGGSVELTEGEQTYQDWKALFDAVKDSYADYYMRFYIQMDVEFRYVYLGQSEYNKYYHSSIQNPFSAILLTAGIPPVFSGWGKKIVIRVVPATIRYNHSLGYLHHRHGAGAVGDAFLN